MTPGSATPCCGTLEKPSASSDLSFLNYEMGMKTTPTQTANERPEKRGWM